MPASNSVIIQDHCSAAIVQRLKSDLLQIGQQFSPKGAVLSDELLVDSGPIGPFVLIVSTNLSLLLRVQVFATAPDQHRVSLTSDRATVFEFIRELQALTQPTAHPACVQERLALAQQILVANIHTPDPIVPLLQALASAQGSTHFMLHPTQSDPIATSQRSQQFLAQLTEQIGQGFELPSLFQWIVDQLRDCLQADRLLIYEFATADFLPIAAPPPRRLTPLVSAVQYESQRESVASLQPYLSSLVWATSPAAYELYCLGHILTTQDVQQPEDLRDGPLELLYESGVRGQLICPILVQGHLWGLLIVQQLEHSPEWPPETVALVQQVAHLMAIALQQQALQQQLVQQEQRLEAQVATRTQELQNALRSLQSANPVKNDFLAAVNHELRTPLTCVIGMSATLLRWSLGPLTEKQRSYLQTIHDSGERLLEMVNDILDFSHGESGKVSLNIREFSLSSIAQQSLHMVRDRAQGRNIYLRSKLNIPPGRDRFNADPHRVKQILFNLLSNAIKFTQPGGRVILRIWVEPKMAMFQIEDNGIGIPEEKLGQLFQKFQQLDTSYHRTYEGTGLGLALTKQLIDLHHGWIEVHSMEGQGSTFTVELPDQGATSHAAPFIESAMPNNRIILLEEQEEDATLICEMLTAAGFHVVWMVEDSTAIQQVRFLAPAAVLMSLGQTTQGERLIRGLRRFFTPEQLRLVALTPSSDFHTQQHLLDSGVDALLAKPINPEHLLHKLETMLNNQDILLQPKSIELSSGN